MSSNRVSNNNGVLVTVLLNHIIDGEASATLIRLQQIPAPVCDGLLLKHMDIYFTLTNMSICAPKTLSANFGHSYKELISTLAGNLGTNDSSKIHLNKEIHFTLQFDK